MVAALAGCCVPHAHRIAPSRQNGAGLGVVHQIPGRLAVLKTEALLTRFDCPHTHGVGRARGCDASAVVGERHRGARSQIPARFRVMAPGEDRLACLAVHDAHAAAQKVPARAIAAPVVVHLAHGDPLAVRAEGDAGETAVRAGLAFAVATSLRTQHGLQSPRPRSGRRIRCSKVVGHGRGGSRHCRNVRVAARGQRAERK